MERLDKIIASQGKYSRSEVKKLVKAGLVTLNGEKVKSADVKADAQKDIITVDGESICYKKHIYIMLNKPQGVVSATDDPVHKTVIDLVPAELYRQGLFPAGRLDGDTTGFVLITDDGDFAHRILSPKNHIMKTYHATLDHSLTEEDIRRFTEGIELKDGTLCLEAQVRMIQEEPPVAEVKIHEGKYHQVKRMFAALGNRVVALRRVKMGGLALDEALPEGQCRELTDEEFRLILSD
ncbi:MAG: rRNA pseudouridine synthase [Clostridia bacterium]|nr:rRNA pseudouridine synthase [Clostridia bacterium]